MEPEREEEIWEPVSPNGKYMESSVMSLSVIAVSESDVPLNDFKPFPLLRDLFLPLNSRFSSIMVTDKAGVKRWKKVEVNLKDHVIFPVFPEAKSPEFYDKCLDEYLTKIGLEQLPQNKPLWELHIIKYPTSTSAGITIFKLHHALGDGFSLMGALLSCGRRANNPSLPLTFPSIQSRPEKNNNSLFKTVPRVFSSIFNSMSDFCSSVMKSNLVEDDLSPIRFEDPGGLFRPMTTTTMTFSVDHIKQIKNSLGATINDVISGIILYGTRSYMEETSRGSGNANSTALVLLNTRMVRSYDSVKAMLKPDSKTPWGNLFAFLHVPLPKLTEAEFSNPLSFIKTTRQIVNKKRSSFAVYLTASLVQMIDKFRGSEAAAKYIHSTVKNASITITNIIGPVEKMAVGNYPIRGLYFAVAGSPQSLIVSVLSYNGNLRVALGAEKDLIDAHKLKSCIQNAFEVIFKAACHTSPRATSIPPQ